MLAAIFVVVAIGVALVQAIAAISASATVTASHSILTAAQPRDRAVQVESVLGDDAQTAAADTLFSTLPLTVSRTIVAPDLAPGVNVLADPAAHDLATLRSGTWPAAGQGALQADAAAALGLSTGDTLTLGTGDATVDIVISGTWTANDPSDPHWFGDPAVASGASANDAGPLVVDEATIRTMPDTPLVRWTLVASPDPSTAGLGGTAAAIDRATDAATADPAIANQYASVAGNLSQTLRDIHSTTDAAARLAIVPAAIVAVAWLLTLSRVVGLLWTTRRGETALLRARGATVPRLAAVAAIEAAVVVLPAVAIGSIVGHSLLLALVLASGALLVTFGRAFAAVLTARRPAATRERGGVTLGAAVLAVVAAGVAYWQFLLYTREQAGANPFGALAPALGLFALALLALTLVPPLFALLEKRSARSRGIIPVLPARQVARGATVYATSILLVVTAVASATLAASYDGTATARELETRLVGVGADVRARLAVHSSVDGSDGFVTAADFMPIAPAVGVLGTEARVSEEQYPLVARAHGTGPTTAEAPVGSRELGVTVTVPPLSGRDLGRLDLAAWIADSDGAATRIPGGRVLATEAGDGTPVSFDLPSAETPWRVLAIEAVVTGISGDTATTLGFSDLAADGVALPFDGTHQLSLTIAHSTGRSLVVDPLGSATPVPIVLTDAAAARLGASPGSKLSIELPATGGLFDAVVTATKPALSGIEGSLGLTADLRYLDDYLLRAGQRVPQVNEIWLTTDTPAETAAQVVRASRYPTTISLSSDQTRASVLRPTRDVLWLGVAGVALLAVIATAAVASALGQLRRRETYLLASLGLSLRRQRAARFAELAVVIAAALVLGLAAGLVSAALFTSTLVTGTLGTQPTAPSFAVMSWIEAVAGIALATLAVGLFFASRLRPAQGED